MTIFFPILLGVIIIACIAMLYDNGLWSNLITFFNVMTAALLATNFFEPLSAKLFDLWPSIEYFSDFLSIWAIFTLAMWVFSATTSAVSKIRVKFVKQVDMIGGYVMALWIGWIMVCFTAATLHMAPLSRNFLFGGFNPETRMFFGTAPDLRWLGFMQRMSLGPLSRTLGEDDPEEKYVFDRKGIFVPMYASRRSAYSMTSTISGRTANMPPPAATPQ